jgi:hypothetical protein
MSFVRDLVEHISADYKVMGVSTPEESRALQGIASAVNTMNTASRERSTNTTRVIVAWNTVKGFHSVGVDPLPGVLKKFNDSVKDPATALDTLAGFEHSSVGVICVMCGLDHFLKLPAVGLRLKAIAEKGLPTASHIVLLSPALNPGTFNELATVITMIDFGLPDSAELETVMRGIEFDVNADTSRTPITCSDELRDRIVQCLRGLTCVEASNTLSRALVRDRNWDDKILDVARTEKARIINNSEALSYVDAVDIQSQDDLGGYGYLVNWLESRREAYSKEARELSIDLPKGICLIGPPGCMDGDTKLLYRRGLRHGGRRISLKSLYVKFNKKSTVGTGAGVNWHKDVPTYLQSYDESTGKVFFNQIVDVIYSGVKKCVKVTLDSGEQVVMTPEHPVLTPQGFVKAGELQTGGEVVCRGHMKPTKAITKKKKAKRVTLETLKYYAGGNTHRVIEPATGVVYTYKRQCRSRLVLEAAMNSMEYGDFVRALKTDPAAVNLKTLPAGVEVHHKNENSMDDSPDNLEVLSKSAHTLAHDPVNRFNVQHTRVQHVIAVEDVGERVTYDIEMTKPADNFSLANGLIVHNSGKSVAAMTTAKVLGLPLFKLDIGAVFAGLVGQSESNLRRALAQVAAQDGCVLMIDEIDKGLSNAHTASGDSGTTSRVFGALLSWLSNKKDRTFVVVTMNRTTGLPPELLRAGRFDAMFYADVPTPDERRQIMEIHLRKRHVNKSGIDDAVWEHIVRQTDQFVGSELEQVVINARYLSFRQRRSGIPALEEWLQAISEVTPLCKLDPEGVKAIRDFCVSRAKPVNGAKFVEQDPSASVVPATRKRMISN